jgi:hypothetical protein
MPDPDAVQTDLSGIIDRPEAHKIVLSKRFPNGISRKVHGAESGYIVIARHDPSQAKTIFRCIIVALRGGVLDADLSQKVDAVILQTAGTKTGQAEVSVWFPDFDGTASAMRNAMYSLIKPRVRIVTSNLRAFKHADYSGATTRQSIVPNVRHASAIEQQRPTSGAKRRWMPLYSSPVWSIDLR